jgi:hypothetical protein
VENKHGGSSEGFDALRLREVRVRSRL